MRNIISACLITICLWTGTSQILVEGGRILIVVPSPSYSHQCVYQPISLALNKRGHEVVIVTPNPVRNSSLKNYTEIDMSDLYGYVRESLGARARRSSPWNMVPYVEDLIVALTEQVYNNSQIQKLYAPNSNEKFDLLITELNAGPGLSLLGHRFNVPLVGIMSLDLYVIEHFIFGVPMLCSHPSNWYFEIGIDENVPLWRRIFNFLICWFLIYRQSLLDERLDVLAKRYLGDDLPHVSDIQRNMSLVLIDQHLALAYARPLLPNVIAFNGIHIYNNPPPLPENMKEFLDGAEDGFIYMSLGTNMRCTELPLHIQVAIVNVFSELPYRVIWKCEGTRENMNINANNTFLSKWTPQQSILAHPNIKLFIYQGGQQSTEEAVHYRVPIIGIPVMFDQGYRIKKLHSLGVGKYLNIDSLTEATFYEAIHDILTDESYKRKMVELSEFVKDEPYDNMEKVIWWLEYVMRHKGTPHLLFNRSHESWYQKYDMDMIAFLAIILFLPVLIIFVILSRHKGLILERMSTFPSYMKNEYFSTRKSS